MVDFLTVELPDPVGIPVNDGQVMSMSPHGEIEWMTPKRKVVQGSWSSSMTFRSTGARSSVDDAHRATWELRAAAGDGGPREAPLIVSGNPAKFLHGHNLFGSADPRDLLDRTMRKAKAAIWPDLFEHPEIDLSEGLISRIDLTSSLEVGSASDVLPILKLMEETIWCPHRGRGVFDGGGSTLYFGRVKNGQRAKDWALKLYWKGAEVTKHPLPEPAQRIPGLIDDLNRTIRVELTLRTAELKRLNLRKIGQWSPDTVKRIWEQYTAMLDFDNIGLDKDPIELASLGIKPRLLDAIESWKSGNDLRATRNRATFYRLRREIKDATGYDIATVPPKSNVVPLRRLVTISPALHPRWADQLTEALEKAA